MFLLLWQKTRQDETFNYASITSKYTVSIMENIAVYATIMGRGDGQVVTVLVSYTDDPSLNPA